ncbi:hypothetical protein KEM56_000630 [Ascosphaera pollenicola]|nr:hypothetical protein KEM56_000630 [Ascosphaera pollenicola]
MAAVSSTLQFTSRSPQWAYLKLLLTAQSQSRSQSPPLDALTARAYLTSALSQHLGLVGTSISIDILKIERLQGRDYLWIRVPRDDATALASALTSWIGNSASETGAVAFRVLEKSAFLGSMIAGSGSGSSAELFSLTGNC